MSNASQNAKVRLLREVTATLMSELNAMQIARWEELPDLGRRRQQLLMRLREFEWGPIPQSPENMDLLFLISQIRDLEYQVRQTLRASLDILRLQLDELRHRHAHWKQIVQPYRNKAGGERDRMGFI